jgi:hypothetical protein
MENSNFDDSKINLEASKSTQLLSTKSVLEHESEAIQDKRLIPFYQTKLLHPDFAYLPSCVETCLNKLEAKKNGFNVNQTELLNCITKLKKNYYLFKKGI